MSYATLEQFKLYLKMPATANNEDDLLLTFLDEASGLIDSIIGFPSAAAAVSTRTFARPEDFTRTGGVLFGSGSVNGITSVTYNDGTVLAPGDYTTQPHSGPYWGLTPVTGVASWRAVSCPAVVVTGYWAYTTNADGTADALIVGATRTLAAWLYREKDNVGTLASSGDGVTVVSAALPSNVLSRLKYRRRML